MAEGEVHEAPAGGHEEAGIANTVILACLGLLIGTFLRFIETQILPLIRLRVPRFALPPFTLSVFLAGAALSAIGDSEARRLGSEAFEGPSILGSIQSAQLVDPEVILLVFLPPVSARASALRACAPPRPPHARLRARPRLATRGVCRSAPRGVAAAMVERRRVG
jgi:hypothetical protein